MGLPCWTVSAVSPQYFLLFIIFDTEMPNVLYFTVMFGFAFPPSIPLGFCCPLLFCFCFCFGFFYYFTSFYLSFGKMQSSSIICKRASTAYVRDLCIPKCLHPSGGADKGMLWFCKGIHL